MSLKDNLDEVKGELLGESRFLEQFIRLEKLVKKYRLPLLALAGLILAGLIGKGVMGWMGDRRAASANAAYLALTENPENGEAQKELESANPALYSLYKLNAAAKSGDPAALEALTQSANPLVARLASYQLASLKGDAASMAAHSMQGDALLKEFALLQEAERHFAEGEIEKGRNVLAAIPFTSPLKSTANLLEHYGVR